MRGAGGFSHVTHTCRSVDFRSERLLHKRYDSPAPWGKPANDEEILLNWLVAREVWHVSLSFRPFEKKKKENTHMHAQSVSHNTLPTHACTNTQGPHCKGTYSRKQPGGGGGGGPRESQFTAQSVHIYTLTHFNTQ